MKIKSSNHPSYFWLYARTPYRNLAIFSENVLFFRKIWRPQKKNTHTHTYFSHFENEFSHKTHTHTHTYFSHFENEFSHTKKNTHTHTHTHFSHFENEFSHTKKHVVGTRE